MTTFSNKRFRAEPVTEALSLQRFTIANYYFYLKEEGKQWPDLTFIGRSPLIQATLTEFGIEMGAKKGGGSPAAQRIDSLTR